MPSMGPMTDSLTGSWPAAFRFADALAAVYNDFPAAVAVLNLMLHGQVCLCVCVAMVRGGAAAAGNDDTAPAAAPFGSLCSKLIHRSARLNPPRATRLHPMAKS